MRRCIAATFAVGTAAQGDCHSISPTVKDDWCMGNCNNLPPNCPASLCECTAPAPGPGPAPVDFPLFQLDLFMNDPNAGWQADGFPKYLETDAAKHMNVAGISFIQPADLSNDAYDLPPQVANAVQLLRKQDVQVQLLIGGQVSTGGWGNPQKQAAKAIELMKKYDVGMQIDSENGGGTDDIIEFIKLCHEGKPDGVHISMDVNGTPHSNQCAVIAGAIDYLQFVNLMVSSPAYDQGNSAHFGYQCGIPYEKMTVAYYAAFQTGNCDQLGSAGSFQTLGYGVSLKEKLGLKGLSVWAVGGQSYAGCHGGDEGSSGDPGFAQTMVALGAHTEHGPTPSPAPTPSPVPPSPTPSPSPGPVPTPVPTPTPTPPPTPPSTPKCCWSAWGDSDSCGSYPSGHGGARCNTDWDKTCSSSSDCATAALQI